MMELQLNKIELTFETLVCDDFKSSLKYSDAFLTKSITDFIELSAKSVLF